MQTPFTPCRFTPERRVEITCIEDLVPERIPGECFCLCCVTRGNLVVKLNGIICYIGSHSVLCLSSEDDVEWIKKDAFHCRTLLFTNAFLHLPRIRTPIHSGLAKNLCCFLNRTLSYPGILPLSEDEMNKTERIFQEISWQLTDQPDKLWSCRTRSMLYSLLRILGHIYYLYKQEGDRSLEQQVAEYIQLNLESQLRLRELSQIFKTNSTTLCKVFKQGIGMTISAYILQERVQRAQFFLSRTELSLTEISERCGFCESSYFSRIFKKQTGFTPLHYRNMKKEGRSKHDTLCDK